MTIELLTAFFHGLTGAGLFGQARLPGAPIEFIDSRSLEEFYATGEFEENIQRYGKQLHDTTRPSKRSLDADRVQENHALTGRR